ncbi:MAG: DEAD/DEAH box helicase, partial [Pseudomonadota bacterium]|nr:DEAD/DEAH box helicase [Pseudomonadota bacterium]
METEQLLLPKLTSSINNKKQLRFGRTYGCSSALIIAEYWASKQQSLLVITPDVQSAESMEEQLNFFCRSICRITIFPDLETLPYDSFSPHSNLIAKRLLTLNQLLENNIDICIVAISTLSNRLPPKTYLYDRSFNFKTGEKVNPAKLKERLQKIGYQRVNQVNEHGEYAVRGSLIDIYSSGMDKPARLDFFDNEIDSIRYFDVENQLSDVHLEQLKILPAREFEITKDSISNFRNRFRERFDGNPSESLIYSEISDQRIPNGIESYLPLFHEKTNTLWDYLSKDFVVFSQGDLEATAEKVWLDIEQRHNELSHDLEKPMLSPEELFCSVKYHLSSLSDLPHIKLISNEIPIQVSNDEVLNLKVSTAPQIMINTRQKDPLRELINFIHSFDGRLLISAETTGRRELLIEMLKENKIIPYVLDNWNDFFHTESKVNIVVAPLENGLSIPDEKIFLITEQELFGSRPKRRKQKRVLDPFAIINDLNDLQIGAPVVHIDYGVGRYCGLSHLEINSIPGDFLTIEYAGGDRLHVPISSLQLISRYTGGAPENAPINRLGTDQWDRRKRKAAEQIRDTAVEMLDLYSSRAARQGYSWKMNPLEYDQFVSEFPFELTEDQSNAIEMTLSDLASNEPMDRLVCGDVGFGKTEVALRAAFVTAMAGGQVALLVPTTLLADQHYRNFYDRFADWPINVAVLSRFRSKKEAEKILEELESGKIDIVIGTHKLLQNDVKIKKLGLLIIDEEHRFGVRHKEKLKKFRTEVDILALTATPIPRTLNMAMGELRKLSIIATPPESRLAVKTFVAEWDNNLLRETCQRELKRGGQIYFVHNRVKGIDAEAKKLSQLIPEAKIRIAHGKMHERDLEQIMLEFYQRKFNILFCTSIIE